jgi:hypothetical protein
VLADGMYATNGDGIHQHQLCEIRGRCVAYPFISFGAPKDVIPALIGRRLFYWFDTCLDADEWTDELTNDRPMADALCGGAYYCFNVL